jgi:hypothetical protein
MQAYSELRRNCARIDPSRFTPSVRRKNQQPKFGAAARHRRRGRLSHTTLVLDDLHSVFSTDAVNHDLIALSICRVADGPASDANGIIKKRFNKKLPTRKAKARLGRAQRKRQNNKHPSEETRCHARD